MIEKTYTLSFTDDLKKMNNPKVNVLLHLIAGIIVLFHGFDSFESGDLHSASAYLGLAILYLLVAGLHKSITNRFLHADSAFYLLESITILYSGWHYKTLNHIYIFYFLSLAGGAFFILSLLSFNNADKPRQRKKHKKRRKRSSIFNETNVSES